LPDYLIIVGLSPGNAALTTSEKLPAASDL